MLLSLVLPTYNKRAFLAAALRALERQTLAREAFEVVVVVDGATDGSAELVAALRPGYTLRHVVQPNAGLAAARNRGTAEATGEHVLFMDDDILLDPAHLERLAAGLAAFPDAVHFGLLRNVAREHVEGLLAAGAWARGWPDIEPLCGSSALYDALGVLFRGRRRDGPGESIPAVWWAVVTGGNLCVPRARLTRVGGFDPHFRGWGPEDADLCYRLFRAGLTGRFHAGCRVYHLDHARDPTRVARELLRNATYLYRKHGRPPELLAYLRFFNGLLSLEEFNNDCARRCGLPELELEPCAGSMREVTRHDQVVPWK